jgi:formylglycine-generating enzyme
MKMGGLSRRSCCGAAAVLIVVALHVQRAYPANAQTAKAVIVIAGAHSTFERALTQPTEFLRTLDTTVDAIEQALGPRPRIEIVGAGSASTLGLKSFTDFQPPKFSVHIVGAGSARNLTLLESTGPLDIRPPQSAVTVMGAGSAREVALADPLATPVSTATPPPTPTATPMATPTSPATVSPIPEDMSTAIPTTEVPVAATPLPTATPKSPNATDAIEMIPIPAGNFTMGSSNADIQAALAECNAEQGNCEEGWFAGERPTHTVFVDTFEIGIFEVTNAQYQLCVDAGACQAAGRSISDANIPFDRRFFADDFPVVGVNWKDANTFCSWAGGRLPTEEEWEKAARGADDHRRYPWGNELSPTKANLSSGFPAAVGSYGADVSPYGVMDMAGNVFEWTATAVEQSYVVRGGGWSKFYFRGRVTDRGTKLPSEFANYDIGFRCAR